MGGKLYRLAIAVKELGERLHSPLIVRIGLSIRDKALEGKIG
jgi:hypothetical protein